MNVVKIIFQKARKSDGCVLVAWGKSSADWEPAEFPPQVCAVSTEQSGFLQSSSPPKLNRQRLLRLKNICILDHFFHRRTFRPFQICSLQMGLESLADWANTQLRLSRALLSVHTVCLKSFPLKQALCSFTVIRSPSTIFCFQVIWASSFFTLCFLLSDSPIFSRYWFGSDTHFYILLSTSSQSPSSSL